MSHIHTDRHTDRRTYYISQNVDIVPLSMSHLDHKACTGSNFVLCFISCCLKLIILPFPGVPWLCPGRPSWRWDRHSAGSRCCQAGEGLPVGSEEAPVAAGARARRPPRPRGRWKTRRRPLPSGVPESPLLKKIQMSDQLGNTRKKIFHPQIP